MATQTLAQLRTEAQAIRDETATGANTALRVGTFLDDFLESQDSLIGDIWEFKLDNQYLLIGNAQAILAGVRTKIAIDGLADMQKSPNHTGDLWNITTQKFEPIAIDDFYHMRFAISGYSDSDITNRFEIEIDVGGTTGIIGQETGVFAKGATTAAAQSFNFSTGFFTGADFLANGGEIYITPDSNAHFYQMAVTINRSYRPML